MHVPGKNISWPPALIVDKLAQPNHGKPSIAQVRSQWIVEKITWKREETPFLSKIMSFLVGVSKTD